MKLLKNGLTIRGDSFYCPLSFQLDTYWACENKCHHCYMRRLNRTWGGDLKPLDIDLFRKKIHNGLNNKNPGSPLAWALKNKKTIRLGNKTDPFQNAELKFHATEKAILILHEYNWTFLIQTKYTSNLMEVWDKVSLIPQNIAIMPIISPGLEKDWELLEKKGTTNPIKRLQHISKLQKENINVGVNGEPFIPGYHTLDDFENTLKILKKYNIKSFNTYNLHFNDLVAKNFHNIGLDIEKIWFMNQDKEWRKILLKLIELSKKYNIILGCPDFINSGLYQSKANTCCGITVSNPCSYNIIFWKKLKIKNPLISTEEIIQKTYDGVGDKKEGKKIIEGTHKEFYTLKDINFKLIK